MKSKLRSPRECSEGAKEVWLAYVFPGGYSEEPLVELIDRLAAEFPDLYLVYDGHAMEVAWIAHHLLQCAPRHIAGSRLLLFQTEGTREQQIAVVEKAHANVELRQLYLRTLPDQLVGASKVGGERRWRKLDIDGTEL